MKIGFHASHEQFTPRHLLELVQKAEQAGFQSVLSSDHFHPWSDKQGESGFAWSWLGAAMQATNLRFWYCECPGAKISSCHNCAGNSYPGSNVSRKILALPGEWAGTK
jgi:coenzyme F420-dependent glucose-6-phosphate dehydrogenase